MSQGSQTTDRTTERRSYFRVNTRLPVRHRKLTPEEAEGYENQFTTVQYGGVTESVDLPLAQALRRIESKVDRILLALYPGANPPLQPGETQPVDLSAGGLRVPGDESIGVGDSLLVEMLVPGAGEDPVQAVARVVRCENAGDETEVALEFTAIDENQRDAILCFTQGVQRRVARESQRA